MIEEEHKYGWRDAEPTCANLYVLPAVLDTMSRLNGTRPLRVLDIGCGNGYISGRIAQLGHKVTGVDASRDGVAIASSRYPEVRFVVASIYDEDLPAHTGTELDCVVSLEVVEHLQFPKYLFRQAYRILRRGGWLIVSTPYHGYLKNLALSLANGWDRHFNVEWDGGHVKFFSNQALAMMAADAGFSRPQFCGVGRLPWLWKSTVMVAHRTEWQASEGIRTPNPGLARGNLLPVASQDGLMLDTEQPS